MPAVQEWIKEQFKKENSLTIWDTIKLTKELQELKDRVKKLEEDLAYNAIER